MTPHTATIFSSTSSFFRDCASGDQVGRQISHGNLLLFNGLQRGFGAGHARRQRAQRVPFPPRSSGDSRHDESPASADRRIRRTRGSSRPAAGRIEEAFEHGEQLLVSGSQQGREILLAGIDRRPGMASSRASGRSPLDRQTSLPGQTPACGSRRSGLRQAVSRGRPPCPAWGPSPPDQTRAHVAGSGLGRELIAPPRRPSPGQRFRVPIAVIRRIMNSNTSGIFLRRQGQGPAGRRSPRGPGGVPVHQRQVMVVIVGGPAQESDERVPAFSGSMRLQGRGDIETTTGESSPARRLISRSRTFSVGSRFSQAS